MSADIDFADDLASLAYAAERQNLKIGEVVLAANANVVLRGMRFHYLDWGNQGKRPILFLHGGGLNAHTYDLVCLALRAEYHCLALDQRGHGDSEWSPVMDYDMRTHAQDIDALVTYLGLDRFVLVGMSMGGINAIQYAGQYPERLAAMVIIDIGPDMQIPGGQRVRDFMTQPTEGDSIDEFIAQALAFNPRRDRRLLRRSILNNLRRTPEGKLAWKWDPRPRRAGFNAARFAERRARLWEQVDRITCPTLVVRGQESDVFSDENAQAFAKRLRDGRHVVVGRRRPYSAGRQPRRARTRDASVPLRTRALSRMSLGSRAERSRSLMLPTRRQGTGRELLREVRYALDRGA